MRAIYKYQLQICDEQIVPMPSTARVLSVENQRDVVTVWAMVDPADRSTKNVKFYVVGTGSGIGFPFNSVRFLGTVLTCGDSLVWHVFYQE